MSLFAAGWPMEISGWIPFSRDFVLSRLKFRRHSFISYHVYMEGWPCLFQFSFPFCLYDSKCTANISVLNPYEFQLLSLGIPIANHFKRQGVPLPWIISSLSWKISLKAPSRKSRMIFWNVLSQQTLAWKIWFTIQTKILNFQKIFHDFSRELFRIFSRKQW